MALYAHFRSADVEIGIWKMEEDEAELLSHLPAVVAQGVERFTAPHRRLEWLSVRMLLLTLLARGKTASASGSLYVADALVGYTLAGAPYLLDQSQALSISHTKGYVAVALAPWGSRPGIDIEQWGERVMKVSSRFLREDEETPLYQGSPVAALLLHWSAKEALYKSLELQEAVDFKEHLRIFPFPLAAEGCFLAQELRTPMQQRYSMAYRLFPDFVLTWVTGTLPA
ncbi:MAG: 4'-phosphopantetheinyl transferase family protein [Bacteroides sp.]